MNWSEIITTLIGAFLAAGTGWLFELRREKARFSQARRLLTTAICDDLQHSITLYDKVAEEWEKSKTVWFSTLNELRESRHTYQNNKDWTNIFDDQELRRKIFRYYLQSAERVNQLEYQQRRKYEIEGKLNDLLRSIKFRDPQISHEVALKSALSYMVSESREYDGLLQAIPDSVAKLAIFKTLAEELLRQLRGQK